MDVTSSRPPEKASDPPNFDGSVHFAAIGCDELGFSGQKPAVPLGNQLCPNPSLADEPLQKEEFQLRQRRSGFAPNRTSVF